MNRTRHIIYLVGILVISGPNIFSQSLPVAKNVDITIEDNKAIIHFDIKSKKPGAIHLVDLKFLDEDYRLVSPNLISGDIGPGIPAGINRTIKWEITNDVELLGSDITPVLFINGKSKQFSNTGGVKNALLSLIFPGLGDYFVADHRMMTFKPYMRSISSLGLIGLGIYAGEQRYRGEGEYQIFMHMVRIPNPVGFGSRYVQEPYEKYVEGPVQHFLFKGDKEVFISLGAAIWAADIIWVLAKGSNNARFMKSATKGSDFNLGYLPGGASLQYSYTF